MQEENRTNHGVYKIINTINNDCYIGSSSNLKSRRYKHFLSLKNDVHANKILQSSYKKHGKENFIWDIIKYVEYKHGKDKLKKELLKWEDYYIEDYKNRGIKLYNIREKAESNLGIKHTKEQNIAKSKRMKNPPEETRKKLSNSHKKPVINITTGKVFNSIKEAAEFYKLKSDTGICEVCRGNKKTAGGFLWSFIREEDLKDTKEFKGKALRSKVINITTGIEFNSITEASNYYNINKSKIGAVCQGKRNTCGGYKWSYN